MWLFFVTQYNLSLLSFVPNFRILKQVVAEKSLTEKKFTDRQTNQQTNKHNYRNGKKLYTPYILRTGGIMNSLVTIVLFLIGSSSFLQVTRTTIKSRMGSKFGKIRPGTGELATP